VIVGIVLTILVYIVYYSDRTDFRFNIQDCLPTQCCVCCGRTLTELPIPFCAIYIWICLVLTYQCRLTRVLKMRVFLRYLHEPYFSVVSKDRHTRCRALQCNLWCEFALPFPGFYFPFGRTFYCHQASICATIIDEQCHLLYSRRYNLV
jgi:hypothetical protein